MCDYVVFFSFLFIFFLTTGSYVHFVDIQFSLFFFLVIITYYGK